MDVTFKFLIKIVHHIGLKDISDVDPFYVFWSEKTNKFTDIGNATKYHEYKDAENKLTSLLLEKKLSYGQIEKVYAVQY